MNERRGGRVVASLHREAIEVDDDELGIDLREIAHDRAVARDGCIDFVPGGPQPFRPLLRFGGVSVDEPNAGHDGGRPNDAAKSPGPMA